MTEENIIAEFMDNEYEAIEVLDLTPVATKKETIQIVNAEDVETFTVTSEESFPALGEPNEQLKHSLLMGRDLPDQHPITSITGLRNELDNIEALQTVYSDKKQNADFYKWEDENPNNENRVGYFVTVCDNIKNIKICQGENIFGVTVDGAAFIGGQDDIARDYKYSLVTHSGIVNVRCELDVAIGDFVISNDYGMAERTGNTYGCKVIAINEIEGIRCATVCLNLPVEQLDAMSQELIDFNVRMEATENDVVSAMNLANEAYNKAISADGVSNDALNNATDALDKVNGALDQLESDVSKIQKQVAEAVNISQSAATYAEELRTNAVNTANDALANVNDLTEKYEPLEEWIDPKTGKVGATYVINYMSENGLATTTDIRTVDTKTEDNKSAIERNAENFTSLVSSVDKYSVGEYSQAYGLTHEQAKSILKVGMVYIPTENNSKKTHEEKYLDTEEINEFTKGRYYTWDGEDWIESAVSRVNFVHSAVPSAIFNDYWYIDSNTAPSGYEPKALYISQDREWVKVNTLAGNCNNRVSSMIRQTSNEIALEVTNARGSYGGLDIRLDGLDKKNEAYASMVASVVNTDGTVNTASIVNAVNESGSSVAINADKIVMTGTTTFLTADDVGASGSTVIDGGRITTGRINANLITTGIIQGGARELSDGSTKYLSWIDLTSGEFQFGTFSWSGSPNNATTYIKPVLALQDNILHIDGIIKNADYENFLISIGPSDNNENNYGALTVTYNEIWEDEHGVEHNNYGDIFQVYPVASDDDEGVTITAPFLTTWDKNGNSVNRKGITILPNEIILFNDNDGRNLKQVSVQTDGTYVYGGLKVDGVTVTSDRELKTNIEEIELTALDKISQLKFYSYDLKSLNQEETVLETPILYNSPSPDEEVIKIEETITSSPVHVDLGIMADEAPTEIQSMDGKGIDLYSYISLNAKAIQELILKIQTLEEEIQSLKNGEI